jgi:hypothetical protein
VEVNCGKNKFSIAIKSVFAIQKLIADGKCHAPPVLRESSTEL